MTLVDAAAREAIRSELDATFVVEAAAGTGKTTAMISRIISVIASGASKLERIVAVTFTEKAAGEMKLRLRGRLEESYQAARGEERTRVEMALKELELTRIGTIHSFCADLLRERPIEARIDPLFEVADSDQQERLAAEAFDAWFQAALETPGEGLRRILRRSNPLDLLRPAATRLLDRRDFPGAWRRDAFDRHAAIDALLTELVALGALAQHASNAKDPLARNLTAIQAWIEEVGQRELVRPRDYDGIEAELVSIERWYSWKDVGRGKLFGKGLARGDVVVQRDAAKASIDALLQAAEADLAACLHAELLPFVKVYEKVKASRGLLDFHDLLVRVRDVLRDDPRVRREMQRRFTHFFVDEFQDTDPLQVDILFLLCADNPADADRRTIQTSPGKLFIVGDPKQAIYRFRRADIALYEGVKAHLLRQGARLLHLSTNFRSVESIQNAVNAAFEPVMRGNGQADYVPLAPLRPDLPGQPAVVALPVPSPYRKRIANAAIEESYPRAVAAFVAHLVTGSGWRVSEAGSNEPVPIAPRHVCLMFRRFQGFGGVDLALPYVRALEARGLEHVLIGGRSFHGREEIQAVRNALHAIEWPDDELSVYATLRGPLFGFHDEDLIGFKENHGRLNPLARVEPCSELTTALALLADMHYKRNRRAIADTVTRLLAATRAHAGLALWSAGDRVLANVSRVLDMARSYEAAGATSFRSFVEALDDHAEQSRRGEAPVAEEGTEGVRVMTVHAAKGLEFPVVILCDPTASAQAAQPSRYIDAERQVWLEQIALCTPVELREQEALVLQRDAEEIQRLAYVAATRARDVLVIPVVGDADSRRNWLETLTAVAYPADPTRRSPTRAPGCPEFGTDSVLDRPLDVRAA